MEKTYQEIMTDSLLTLSKGSTAFTIIDHWEQDALFLALRYKFVDITDGGYIRITEAGMSHLKVWRREG
jgi:hypothetical protein